MELLIVASALVSIGQVHSCRLSIMGFSPYSRLVDKQELTKSDLGMTKENMDTDPGRCQKFHQEVNARTEVIKLVLTCFTHSHFRGKKLSYH